jgi:hypothetical protein
MHAVGWDPLVDDGKALSELQFSSFVDPGGTSASILTPWTKTPFPLPKIL